jgi:hypothetical protein
MNVFYLDPNPYTAAEMQCDRHVVKMILESAQLLSTAHRELDGDAWADKVNLYKATHKNHPSAIWCRASIDNYRWLYQHFIALCHEYTYRYKKEHLSYTKLAAVLFFIPSNLTTTGFTEPTPAMDDEYKRENALESYRYYYANAKSVNDWFCYNKSRSAPEFIKEYKEAR